jgi:hypothetical protein
VSLAAVQGLLTLRNGGAGLTFVSGAATASAAMVFQGSLAAVAAALEQLRFTPAHDHNGAARIDIGVNDLGNGGGSPRTASASLALVVNAVNDPPTLTLPGPQSTAFGTPLGFSSASGNAITLGDVDAGSAVLTSCRWTPAPVAACGWTSAPTTAAPAARAAPAPPSAAWP